MKKAHYDIILFYVIMLLLSNCKMPEDEIKQATKEIITEKERFKMELKPIEVYEKYALIASPNNSLYGLQGADKKIVPIEDIDGNIYRLNDFFKSAGIIYFNVKVMEKGAAIPETDPVQYEQVEKIYYFKQTGNNIVTILESAYPVKQASDFVTMKSDPFEIIKYDDHSRVIKNFYDDKGEIIKSSPTAFVMIDGFHETPEGLWLSVPETIATRLKGVYFYPVGGKLPLIPGFMGRIW